MGTRRHAQNENHRFGKYAREHTEECRKRIIEAQGSSGKGDEKRKTAEERMKRQQERSEGKDKPKEASGPEKAMERRRPQEVQKRMSPKKPPRVDKNPQKKKAKEP